MTRVKAIAAGNAHCLALMTDGSVRVWGSNAHGQLDLPPDLVDITTISAGGYFSLAVKDDGTVTAWGSPEWGLTWVPEDLTDVASVAAGETSFAVAVHRDGQMTAWGNNHFGESDVSRWSHLWIESAAAGFTNGIALAGSAGPVVWGRTDERMLSTSCHDSAARSAPLPPAASMLLPCN